MMQSLFPLLIPLTPLVAALFTALPNRYLQARNYHMGWWFTFVGFVASLWVLWQAIQNPEPSHLVLFKTNWSVLPVIELTIDRLSAVMMVVISGFSTLLYRYSIRYMQQDAGQNRYQTLLAIKSTILLLMVSSADLVVLFIFWQISGWILSLLSHRYGHVPTANGAFRTFIMLRAGDLAFVAGVVLAYHLYGTVQFSLLFERAAMDQTVFTLWGSGLEVSGVTLVTLFIFLGAMCKSAQFPMHLWLPESLYAPTPVSAMLHSGGVNAGGFLLTRLAPLYVLSPLTLHVVLGIGLMTAIVGTAMMLVQNDIKKSLGYSTIGQMGYMMMECGLGAFSLAVFHLIAHGLFKADMFLSSGAGIQEARLRPAQPPEALSSRARPAGRMGWVGALLVSLLLPLGIVVVAHEAMGSSFLNAQGLFILLLFSWVTASHAMLTMLRLQKPRLTTGLMGVVLVVGVTAYFFAAEQFTYFLFPNPEVVATYFQAAALPNGVYIALAALLVISIAVGGYIAARPSHTLHAGSWVARFRNRLYLLCLNRLYLEAFVLRFFNTLKTTARRLEQSSLTFPLMAGLALMMAFVQTAGFSEYGVAIPLQTGLLLLLSALLLPLFPLHGGYVSALTRSSSAWATALSLLLPVTGLFILTMFLPQIPAEVLPAIGVLSVAGALWGSFKALLQPRVIHRLSYGGCALYSLLWWHMAQAGRVMTEALLYAVAVTTVWFGLFFAWNRLQARYGTLASDQMGGLFQVMPRFALCLGVLVMAAVGLPPFGLFFGYFNMLLSPSVGVSVGWVVILATWFVACWSLFKLMQQLLFGPHRQDLHYEDLRPAEVLAFLLVIILQMAPVTLSQDWLPSDPPPITEHLEKTPGGLS